MNAIVRFRLCSLSDRELVEKVDAMTDEMYENNKVHPRNIPARPDQDYDPLLVGVWSVKIYGSLKNFLLKK